MRCMSGPYLTSYRWFALTVATLHFGCPRPPRDRDESVAPHKQPLQPFVQLLAELIDSPAYDHAASQLLIMLQKVPDRVDE